MSERVLNTQVANLWYHDLGEEDPMIILGEGDPMTAMTPIEVAMRFVGVKEVSGSGSNAMILSMLQLDNKSAKGDEVPWCSAFVNYIAWLFRLPRSKSLAARSWLGVGNPIRIPKEGEVVEWYAGDVVILKRGSGEQPGPEVLNAPGHVGFFVRRDGNTVYVLGGNQKDTVSVAPFPVSQILGVRRLW